MPLNLVFLHGWVQSPAIWCRQQAFFAPRHRLYTPALPGHGGAPFVPAEQWLERLAAQLPPTTDILIGWSLGGLMAMQLTLAMPQRFRGLVLIATTPCFVARPDWPYGIREGLLAEFKQAAAAPSPRLLGRFFHLMLHGDGLVRSQLRALAAEVRAKAQLPPAAALAAGLQLLADLDLRQQLAAIRLPCLVVHGREDAIVPVAAGRWLAEHLPQAQWLECAGCGHAPFLTRAQYFNERMEAWWQSAL